MSFARGRRRKSKARRKCSKVSYSRLCLLLLLMLVARHGFLLSDREPHGSGYGRCSLKHVGIEIARGIWIKRIAEPTGIGIFRQGTVRKPVVCAPIKDKDLSAGSA